MTTPGWAVWGTGPMGGPVPLTPRMRNGTSSSSAQEEVFVVKPQLLCLEGQWDEGNGLLDPSTVEPVMELAVKLGLLGAVVHRDVATAAEFEHYLDAWLAAKAKRLTIGYLAFHGLPGVLCIGGEEYSLDRLAESIRGRGQGRVLYLGSCLTLAQDAETLRSFCGDTGIKALVGYTASVDFVESAAFDLIVLCDIAKTLGRGGNMKPIFNRLRKLHGSSITRLGFRMATSGWVTDDKIAREPVLERLRDAKS